MKIVYIVAIVTAFVSMALILEYASRIDFRVSEIEKMDIERIDDNIYFYRVESKVNGWRLSRLEEAAGMEPTDKEIEDFRRRITNPLSPNPPKEGVGSVS